MGPNATRKGCNKTHTVWMRKAGAEERIRQAITCMFELILIKPKHILSNFSKTSYVFCYNIFRKRFMLRLNSSKIIVSDSEYMY